MCFPYFGISLKAASGLFWDGLLGLFPVRGLNTVVQLKQKEKQLLSTLCFNVSSELLREQNFPPPVWRALGIYCANLCLKGRERGQSVLLQITTHLSEGRQLTTLTRGLAGS